MLLFEIIYQYLNYMLKNFGAKIYHIYRIVDIFFGRISKHHIFLISAGISFNMLLYSIPLFLIALYIVNLIFDYSEISETIENFLLNLLPPTSSAKEIIHTIVEEIRIIGDRSKLFGWIGIFVLLWISSTLLNAIRNALNLIFGIKTEKIFIIYRLKDILLTIILTILIFISSYIVPISSFILSFIKDIFPDLINSLISQFWFKSLYFISSFFFFFFLFRFVPNERLPRLVRLIATTISVIVIELSRYGFAWYLTTVSDYGKFYGAYAVIVSTAIWIYYFNLIILLSAELSQYIYDLRNKAIIS